MAKATLVYDLSKWEERSHYECAANGYRYRRILQKALKTVSIDLYKQANLRERHLLDLVRDSIEREVRAEQLEDLGEYMRTLGPVGGHVDQQSL